MNATDFTAAIASMDLATLARHVALSARQSALENGSATPEVDAANRVDDWTGIVDVCGCSALVALCERDLKMVGRLAVAMLQDGRV